MIDNTVRVSQSLSRSRSKKILNRMPNAWLVSFFLSFLVLFILEYGRLVLLMEIPEFGVGTAALGFVLCLICSASFIIKFFLSKNWFRDQGYFLGLFLFFVLLIYFPLYERSYLGDAFPRYVAIFFSYAVMFLVGIRLGDFDPSKRFGVYFFAFLAIATFFVSSFLVEGLGVAWYSFDGQVSGVTHHAYAASIFFIAAFSVFYIRGWMSILFIFASAIVIVMNGSRADVLGLLLFLIVFYGRAERVFWISLLVFSLIVAAYFLNLIPERFLELMDLGSSSSNLARNELMKEGQRVISENIFSGKIGYQVYRGEFGDYIHNFLSVWSQYGVVVFGLFIYLMARPVFYFYRRRKGVVGRFGFSLGCAISLLVLTSKSFVWTYPALYWGVYLGVASRNLKSRGEFLRFNYRSTSELESKRTAMSFRSRPLLLDHG